jgi:hypothetical protein
MREGSGEFIKAIREDRDGVVRSVIFFKRRSEV